MARPSARGLSAAIGDMSGLVLLVLGLALAAVGLFVEDRDAVATTALILGFVSVVAGVLMERLEGPLEMTPTGFKGTLRADARALGIAPDVAEILVDRVDELRQALDEQPSLGTEDFSAAVRKAIAEHEEAREARQRLIQRFVEKNPDWVPAPQRKTQLLDLLARGPERGPERGP